MVTYSAPLEDIGFVLNELLDYRGTVAGLPGYEEAATDVVEAVLEEGAKFCENELLPLNQSGDEEGCTFENGLVRTPRGFKEAYKAFAEGGWTGLSCDPAYGGQGLPYTLQFILDELICSTNLSFGMYPGLSHGAYHALVLHGSDEQKTSYLPRLTDGTWSGTMCLTESHCGTDLGLIRTKAEPNDNGTYKITGTKIFISAGEHDLTENIVHLVLAKLPDAPPGSRARRAAGQPRHFAVHRAQVPGQGGRRAGAAQRRGLWLDRAQDGHQGVSDLRPELRRGRGHPGRRAAQGHALHVHDDERRAPGRRHPGARPGGDRLPVGRGLRQGTPAGPLADRSQEPGQAGGSDHRAPGRAQEPADHAGLQRGRAGACAMVRHGSRRRGEAPRARDAAGGRRPGCALDTDHQGLLHRLWLRGD
jgi:hypothetical protein